MQNVNLKVSNQSQTLIHNKKIVAQVDTDSIQIAYQHTYSNTSITCKYVLETHINNQHNKESNTIQIHMIKHIRLSQNHRARPWFKRHIKQACKHRRTSG